MSPFLRWVEKNPAVKFCIIFILGILSGSIYQFPIYLTLSIPVIFFILYIRLNNPLLLILAIFSVGLLKANLDFFISGNDNVDKIPDSGKFEYTISGNVNSVISQTEDASKLILDAKYIYNQSDSLKITGKILVNIFKGEFIPNEIEIPDLKQNYYIKITGRFNSPFPPVNPGEFNYARYLELNGINKSISTFDPRSVKILSYSQNNNFLAKMVFAARNYSDNIIEKYYTGDSKGFIEGLITGQRDDISEETKTNFINIGIMHILAVSGFNVAMVMSFILIALSLFKFNRRSSMMVAIPFLIFYCFFTTMAPSIVRATIMGILVVLGFLIERKILFYNIVAVAAIIILALDAKQIYDAGFILSFIAVISMVFVYNFGFKKFEKKLFRLDNTNNSFSRWIIMLVLYSFSAIIGTLPISAYFFDKIPVVSIVANVIAVPIANLILITGFLQIFFSLFSDFISSSISYLNNFILHYFFQVINLIANIKFAYFKFYKFDVLNIIVYYTVLSLIITSVKSNLFKRLIFSILLIISSLIFSSLNLSDKPVTILSYQNSEAILFQGNEGKNILVFKGKDFRKVKNNLIPYLNSLDIYKIDVLIFPEIEINEGVIYEFKSGITIGEIFAPYHNNFNYNSIGAGNEIIIDKNSALYFTRPFYNEINNLNFTYINSNDKIIFNNEGLKFNDKAIDIKKTGALVFKSTSSGLDLFNWR